MKRYPLWLFFISLSLILGYHIVTLWRGRVLSQKDPLKEALVDAIRADPDNPAPFYKLGLLHQWSLRQVDLKESERYFEEAIERNPLEQEYWLNLARVFRMEGKGGDYERALDNAILVSPTKYRGRWVAGDLFLQQGALEKALPQFSYILTHYPDQSPLVYEVWKKVVDDPDFAVENLVPRDPSALKRYLSYVYDSGDKESARKAWEKKTAFGFAPNPSETLRHIDFLISQGVFNEAFELWRAKLKEEGASPSDGNLITNGSFEIERAGGSGFDWKIGQAKGAEISFDESVSFEGKRSLKIFFNGEENIDFQQIAQVVAWKPDTDYSLRARMKTKGITTKSGLKIDVSGMGEAFHRTSESLTGDNAWREVTLAFRTPPGSHGGQVRVRRERTEKFDRLISGEVWVDDVYLSEVSSPH